MGQYDMPTRRAVIRPETAPKRSLLGHRQKLQMLAVCLRLESSFRTAQPRLLVEYFRSEEDKGLGLIWASALQFFREHQRLPEQEEDLMAVIQARIDMTGGTYLTADEVSSLDADVMTIYGVHKEKLYAPVGMNYLRMFLEEQQLATIRSELNQEDIASDWPALLRQHGERATAIRAISGSKVDMPFPDEDATQPEAIHKIRIGISWLQEFTDGGQAAKEVYGFCGPLGSCKTTLAVALASEMSMHLLSTWKGALASIPRVYLFAWEEEIESLRLRAMSYVARIPRSRLEAGNLSTSANLADYERKRYALDINKGARIPGEQERRASWREKLNAVLRFVDFTGEKDCYREPAADMVQGMQMVIEQQQAQEGWPGVAMVVADYAGAAAKRYCQRKGIDRDRNLRHLISEMPLALKHEIAIPHKCPVWVMHQTSTEANARNPGIEPRDNDISESKNFFENTNFGWILGKPDQAQYCICKMAKGRRVKRQAARILRIDGEHGRVIDASKTHAVSDRGGIQPIDNLRKVADDMANTQAVNGEASFNNRYENMGQ